MPHITANGKNVYQIEPADGGWLINSQLVQPDIAQLAAGRYHVLLDHQSYVVDVISRSADGKELLIRVNGRDIALNVKDRMDLLLQKMGLESAGAQKVNQIKAPMPGLIVSVNVEAGAPIEKGDALLVLEAMKMENVLKAPGSGKVKAIKVKKGDAVEKNQLLIELE